MIWMTWKISYSIRLVFWRYTKWWCTKRTIFISFSCSFYKTWSKKQVLQKGTLTLQLKKDTQYWRLFRNIIRTCLTCNKSVQVRFNSIITKWKMQTKLDWTFSWFGSSQKIYFSNLISFQRVLKIRISVRQSLTFPTPNPRENGDGRKSETRSSVSKPKANAICRRNFSVPIALKVTQTNGTSSFTSFVTSPTLEKAGSVNDVRMLPSKLGWKNLTWKLHRRFSLRLLLCILKQKNPLGLILSHVTKDFNIRMCRFITCYYDNEILPQAL